jgi:hypothetical protein
VAFDTDLIQAGQTNPVALLTAKVRWTIVGGRVVYE